jgi:anaphase-promoting complex subunit 8
MHTLSPAPAHSHTHHPQLLFEQLRDADPHRLDNMDTFSNILYIKEARPALSFLAHAAHANDRYRAETCCITGNYYSLRGDHARALVYFKRALRVNPLCLAAWTLMGHGRSILGESFGVLRRLWDLGLR